MMGIPHYADVVLQGSVKQPIQLYCHCPMFNSGGVCFWWDVLLLWLLSCTTELDASYAAGKKCSSSQKTSVLPQITFEWPHIYIVWQPASTIYEQFLYIMCLALEILTLVHHVNLFSWWHEND
jgi:hypothetical protein